jgi:hypothetical protein
MLGAVHQLIEACKDSREIRPGASGRGFLLLVGLLWRIPSPWSGEARVKTLKIEASPYAETFSSREAFSK